MRASHSRRTCAKGQGVPLLCKRTSGICVHAVETLKKKLGFFKAGTIPAVLRCDGLRRMAHPFDAKVFRRIFRTNIPHLMTWGTARHIGGKSYFQISPSLRHCANTNLTKRLRRKKNKNPKTMLIRNKIHPRPPEKQKYAHLDF